MSRSLENHPKAEISVPSASYASAWRVWLPVPVLLLLFGLAFDAFFWRLPKLSGPGDDWGYQFLLDMQRLHAPKPAGGTRVIAFGSSVAMSFDPWQIENLLNAGRDPAAPVDVHRLLLPSVHPSSYRPFWDAEVEDLRPDVSVPMLNLLDFLGSEEDREANPTLHAALPPWPTLRERWPRLSAAEKIDWGLSGLSNLYRYRNVLRSSLHDHLKALPQFLRRRRPETYGVFADGFTRPQFGFPLAESAPRRFEYLVRPEWLQQRGRVGLTFSLDGSVFARRTETEPGWKTVDLPAAGRSGSQFFEVAADGPWSPRASGSSDDVRLLGVQLRQPPPGAGADAKRAPWRYPPHSRSSVKEFLRLGGVRGDEFAARWAEMMGRNDAFGARFRAYRDEKLRACGGPFAVTLEYAELERMVAGFSRRGVRVVLVNTPESPWLLRECESGPYYRGYLAFFEELTRKYPGVRFADLRSALPPEEFNDWHHPNYIGVIELGPKLAAAVQPALVAARPHR